MWRRILLGFVFVTGIGGATFSLAFWLTRPEPGVSVENYHRLRWGMNKAAVEHLMGDPGDHRGDGHYCWSRPGYEIWVRYDPDDWRVDEANLYLGDLSVIAASLPEPTNAELLRRMLGW